MRAKANIKAAQTPSTAVKPRKIQNVDEPNSEEIIPGAEDNLKAKPTAIIIAAACELYIVPRGRFCVIRVLLCYCSYINL